jgi:hypothetical protein
MTKAATVRVGGELKRAPLMDLFVVPTIGLNLLHVLAPCRLDRRSDFGRADCITNISEREFPTGWGCSVTGVEGLSRRRGGARCEPG